MKSNWLRYVAILAALIAGTVCSTAFADGKGGFKFGGGGGGGGGGGISLRSAGGMSPGRTVQPNFNSNALRNLSGQVQGIQTRNLQGQVPNLGGIGNKINKVQPGQGTLSPILGNNGNAGRNIGSRVGNVLGNTGIAGGQTPIKIHPGNVLQPGGNGNKVGIGGHHLGIGGELKKNIGIAIGNTAIKNTIGNVVGNNCHPGDHGHGCEPHKIGCKPWWWNCTPCYSTCYKPCYPTVYTQPIVVQVPVPVQAPVVGEAVPVASEQPLMQVPAGATLTLQSPNLGDAAGQVMLQIDKVVIPAMINEWKPDAVTTTLPLIGLAAPAVAEIVMVKADGTVANSIKVELINAQQSQSAQQVQADLSGAAAAMAGLAQ
jgi:hypothetical protein